MERPHLLDEFDEPATSGRHSAHAPCTWRLAAVSSMSSSVEGTIRGRIRARRCAVQAIYQWQMAGQDPRDILSEFVAERELVKVDMSYFKRLIQGIPAQIEAIENQLAPVLDRPLDQLGPVERAILYIGVYELCFCPEIPWRVVVNEGVELTRMFGAEEAYKYVNGTLDRLARSLRGPPEIAK